MYNEQIGSFMEIDAEKVEWFVDKLVSELDTLGLNPEDKAMIIAEVESINAHLKNPRRRDEAILQSLITLNGILEGATSATSGQAIIATLGTLL
jgi:hypothetical protein